jgi:hypothetical protein
MNCKLHFQLKYGNLCLFDIDIIFFVKGFNKFYLKYIN